MRDLANLLVQLALIVGILLTARLIFDLSLGGVLAGSGAGLGIAVTQYVRARRATRATVHGDGRRIASRRRLLAVEHRDENSPRG